MPWPAMRSRRKRRPIAWEPLLWVLLAFNIFAGLYASRLTSMILIRVEGAQPDDRARIKAILERVHSQPALQLNKHETESRILAKSAVREVEMTRNIFGRARVKVTYNRPVAAIANMPGTALSEQGNVFQTSEDLTLLPKVWMPSSARMPIVSLLGSWESRETARLAIQSVDLPGSRELEIIASEDGGLCLNIGSKFSVELGLPEKLEDKLAAVRNMIEDSPDVLNSGQTLNLVSLDLPSIRKGNIKSR